jgi:hypothetical protein
MKNLTLFVCLIVSFCAHAQQFEGTVKWAIGMEFKDSARQAQFDKHSFEADKAAKEAKEGPEKKNDLMAKQQEQRMQKKNGSPFPRQAVVSFRNGNTLTRLDGGPRNHEILYLKDKDQMINLNRKEKTFMELPVKQMSEQQAGAVKPKVTKTSETAKILDYNCTKYIIEAASRAGRPVTQEIWATTEIKDIDMSSLGKQRMGKIKWMLDEVQGVPLKMILTNEDGKVTMQATEIKSEPLDEKLFLIPEGFTDASKGPLPPKEEDGKKSESFKKAMKKNK